LALDISYAGAYMISPLKKSPRIAGVGPGLGG